MRVVMKKVGFFYLDVDDEEIANESSDDFCCADIGNGSNGDGEDADDEDAVNESSNAVLV
jgi:hypothetical protein